MHEFHARLRRSWFARHPVARIVLFIVGLLLVIIGGVLGFVPFVPGWPLGLVGAVLMSVTSNRVRALMWRLTARFPEKFRHRLRFLNHEHDEEFDRTAENGAKATDTEGR